MLVVLAIMAMLMGVSLPFTSGFGKGLKIKTTARAILGTLRLARSNAITHRGEYSVIFDASSGEYWIEDPEGGILEKKYRITSAIKFKIPDDENADPITFEGDKVVFYPTGGAKGSTGSITISDKRGQSRVISIITGTGKITIE